MQITTPHHTKEPSANQNLRSAQARVEQCGRDGMNIVFDAQHFDKVAEIVKPKRRRRLSGKHRQKWIEAGQKTRFRHGVHDDFERLERSQEAMEEPKHQEGRKGVRRSDNRREPRGQAGMNKERQKGRGM